VSDQGEFEARVLRNVHEVRERIAKAGGRDVRLVAVTKTFGVDAVRAAVAARCDAIGENYAQELVAKLSELEPLPEVHFIGQLQSNKVRLIAPLISVYETVDRESLAAEIARRAPGATVLIQVHTDLGSGRERGKGGCLPADVPALVGTATSLGLDVAGLMTVGPTEGGPQAARPGFRQVRALVDRLGLRTCSMGMSDDLEVAVEEGSTQVRVGSALFGPRPPMR
jgi:pyridoxal phosphate enzyme (YggS family)